MQTRSFAIRFGTLLALVSLLSGCEGNPAQPVSAPVVTLTSPAPDTNVMWPTVGVTGMVTHTEPVTRFAYTVNGGEEVNLEGISYLSQPNESTGELHFQVVEGLVEGRNTITVLA